MNSHLVAGWQNASAWLKMSTYFESLKDKEKERYAEKLSFVGLSIEDDPYLPESEGKFKADMTTWPTIEYGHIFVYFIRRPGVYSQEQLMSWKQLEAFNYFQWLCKDSVFKTT